MEIFVHKKGRDCIEEGFKLADLPKLLEDQSNIVWVDFDHPSLDDDKILADVFKFHPLTIEDARETRNQPKVEAFPNYLYFIVHGVKSETNSQNFSTKELDGFLGKNFVVTYHHEQFDSIDSVKKQIRSSPFACEHGADYLLHQILDRLVDLYIPVIDDFDDVINNLEDRIFEMNSASNEALQEIMNLKRNVARLIRTSSKQMNVLYRFSHGEFPMIEQNHLPFFRDIYDHLQRISDMAENYRDLIGGLLDIHLSVVANRTNEVMKVLAVFSAIILPLSLIAGIYGMNFENIPELHTKDGYFVTILFMFLIAAGLIFYFWRKGWILQPESEFDFSKMRRKRKSKPSQNDKTSA